MFEVTNTSGLTLDMERMSPEQAEMLMQIQFMVMGVGENALLTKESDLCREAFPLAVIQQRIDGLNLPIRLTEAAAMGLIAIGVSNPGQAVAALIDCLNYGKLRGDVQSPIGVEDYKTVCEKNLITLGDICEKIYPYGFYSEEGLTKYIDCYLKDKKFKETPEGRWATIY